MIIATFADASETMIREMVRGANSKNTPAIDEEHPAATDTQHFKDKLKLVSIPEPDVHRQLFCYFFDFEARFFNSKVISNAFVDMLRSTYVFVLSV